MEGKMTWRELCNKVNNSCLSKIVVGIDADGVSCTFKLNKSFLCEAYDDEESFWIEDGEGNTILMGKEKADIKEMKDEANDMVGYEINYSGKQITLYI
jgi:hypothetical protein